MPELLTACAGCGRAMNPNAVLYDSEARPVCDACYAKADLLATDRRAADNIRKAGYATLAGGILALFAPLGGMNFLIVALIATIGPGVYALQSFARGNERFTRHITPAQQRVVWGCTITGLCLAALSFMGVNFATLIFLR